MKLERLLAAIPMFILLVAAVCPASSQTQNAQTQPSAFDEAIATEDPEARITALQRILRARPEPELANQIREAIVASWAQLGESHLNDNNIEKAVGDFRKAITALPDPVTDKFFQETVIRIPLAVSVRGYRSEAVELGRSLVQRFPKEAAKLATLGEFFMTIEAPTDAIQALESAAKASEPDALLHKALGAAYRMGLRLDDSISEYQQAIGIDPNDKRAYYELANLYRAYGAYADAIKLYQKQLEIEPKHSPSFKGLALTYLALGNEPSMVAALNQARDLRGTMEEITGDIYLQTQMAFYYLAQGKLKQARQASEAALMIEPRYAWARIAAAEVDMADGKIFEAERNLLAAQRYAGFPTLFFTFGKLYLSVEDFDGAADQFAKAFSISTKESKEIFSARLGGTLDLKAEGLKELLAREHQASIFIANSPTSAEQFRMAESLARFHTWLAEIKRLADSGKGRVTQKQMEELDRAAMDFVEVESSRRSYRSLYVAQKLSQAGIATGLAIELAEQALGTAEAATANDGSVREYPNYDRTGRLQVFRGRALDAKGWAQYKAGQTDEAVATLGEAVKSYGSLPESKGAKWHLAVVKETAGELNDALDLYLAGYEAPEAGSADVKLAVIEVLYRKANGSTTGLEERLRQAGINATIAANQPEPAPTTKKSSKSAKPQSRGARSLPPAEEKKSKLESGKADLRPAINEMKLDPAPIKQPDSETEKPSAPAESEKGTDLKKDEELKAEAVSAKIMPIALPEILPTSSISIPLTPLFDSTTIYSQLETFKPEFAFPVSEEQIPPPPVKTHTRPRRVSIPAQPKPNNP